MIGILLRNFWFPIIVLGAIAISAVRAARRLNSVKPGDKQGAEPGTSGQIRPPRSVAAQIVVAASALVFLALVQYSPRVALVQPAVTDYAVVAMIAAAIVVAIVRLRQTLRFSARPPLTKLALWFAVAAMGVSAVLRTANALLDSGPVREFTTVVASAHCARRGSDLTVRGAPALPVAGDTMQVNVISSVCRKARGGDTLVVAIGPGFLGRPWVQAAHPVQRSF
jgi:hypothetical protein